MAFEISKLCSKFSRQLDGNSWDDQVANGSINTFPTFFNPFNHPLCVCQRLLVIPSSFVPYSSLTTLPVWSVTFAGKWATVSNLFQPALPSCWPSLPPPPPCLTPSVQLLLLSLTFLVGARNLCWDVACRFTCCFCFHVSLNERSSSKQSGQSGGTTKRCVKVFFFYPNPRYFPKYFPWSVYPLQI